MVESASRANHPRTVGLLPLALCFFLSGSSALILQITWTQQLSLLFGASEAALGAVLASYMGGLCLGSLLIAAALPRVRRPLRLYAWIELGIAGSALAVPYLIGLVGVMQDSVFGATSEPETRAFASYGLDLLGAFVILGLPTALMGATLPLLSRQAVQDPQQIGRRVGFLYAMNTLGAAVGVLLAAFVLLPRFDQQSTVYGAVGLNVLVFVLARWILPSSQSVTPVGAGSQRIRSATWWILPSVWLAGVCSFAQEVLWTRLLTHLLGSSIYAFGSMLAVFLVGLAIGAALAGRVARRIELANWCFVAVMAASALAFAWAWQHVQGMESAPRHSDMGGLPFFWFCLRSAAVTLLPGAILIGASFPLAVRIHAGAAGEAGRSSALVYVWNTLGAVVGALFAGHIALPKLGFEGTETLLLALTLTVALWGAVFTRSRSGGVLVAFLAVLIAMGLRPGFPWHVLRQSPLGGQPLDLPLGFHQVGSSATISLSALDGDWRLSSNGLPESVIQARGARKARFEIAHWMRLLPLTLRPQAEELLVVGLGAGITASSLPKQVQRAWVIELEPAVLHANQALAGFRDSDPLADPRLKLVLDDARSALRRSGRRLDVIVSQPSHPWTSGAANLFTREFFELVSSRLEPNGVFVQWIGLEFVDGPLLADLLATLKSVFPQVEVYQPGGRGSLLFVASQTDLTPNSLGAALQSDWAELGVLELDDLLLQRRLTAADVAAAAAGGRVSTDASNRLRVAAPRALRAPLGVPGLDRHWQALDPWRAMPPPPRDLWRLRRLLMQGNRKRAELLAESWAAPARAPWHAMALNPSVVDRPRSAGDLDEEQAHWLDAARPDDSKPRPEFLSPGSPDFEAFQQHRIDALEAEGRVAAAEAALVLVDQQLARRWSAPGLLQRARLGLSADRPEIAVASLFELAGRVRASSQLARAHVAAMEALIARLESEWPQWQDATKRLRAGLS